MIRIIARADCEYCHGSGTVTDWVTWGFGNTAMDSECEDCVIEGWPESADENAEYELVSSWYAQEAAV